MGRTLPPFCCEYQDHDNPEIVRVYLRKKGQKKIRLQGVVWSEEFMKSYHAALKGTTVAVAASRISTGTWAWLCREYLNSPDFKRECKDSTQRVRRGILESTFIEPVDPADPSVTFGDMPIVHLTKKNIRILRDRKGDMHSAANNRLKAIRAVFKYGAKAHEDIVLSNPARDVDRIQLNSEGHYTWTVEDIEKFRQRHAPGSMARRALSVLMYTGVRRSDIVGLGRQLVKDGILTYKMTKGRKTKQPKIMRVPVLPELADELTRGDQNHLTWITTSRGKPFTIAGFGNWFRERCDEADLPQCSAHGVRKAGACIAAENGASDAQLQAIFGWDTAKQAAEYRKKASQKIMAEQSMHLLKSVPVKKPPGHFS